MPSATAVAFPNIAFIKYWGNRDDALRLPANGSIAMNLDGLETRTSLELDPRLAEDEFTLQGVRQNGIPLERVSAHLDILRGRAGASCKARVESENNFPLGAGIASSASAFAALTLAAADAMGLNLPQRELSILARRGSGSASRSIPDGFTEWYAADADEGSFAESIAAPDHWALVDWIAILDAGPKKVGSAEGNQLARTSPLQAARVADAPRRLEICRRAIRERDFPALAEILEEDTRLMHEVMRTSTPSLNYWKPATLDLMRSIPEWRAGGLPVAFTIDAGPNVHCLCPEESSSEVERRLRENPAVRQVLRARPGLGARVVASKESN
jgi:diphosphomevalonate decarboxylase